MTQAAATAGIFHSIFQSADALQDKVTRAAELAMHQARESELSRHAITLTKTIADAMKAQVDNLREMAGFFRLDAQTEGPQTLPDRDCPPDRRASGMVVAGGCSTADNTQRSGPGD